MIRVIIDTNVLVSAAIADRDPEFAILLTCSRKDCEWVVSEEILTEYKQVLSRKRLKLSEEKKNRWFHVLDTLTTSIEVELSVDFPRDRKDAKFIACAIAGNVNYLVTGDRDFLEARSIIPGTQIITVSESIEVLESGQ